MNKYFIALGLSLSIGSTVAGEQSDNSTEFNWSLGASYFVDDSDVDEFSGTNFALTYDFLTIDQDNGPFGEAIFIGKQNRVALSLSRGTSDSDSQFSSIDSDTDGHAFEINYFGDSGFFFGFAYSDVDLEGTIRTDTFNARFRSSLSNTRTEFGYFVGDNFIISLLADSPESARTEIGIRAKKIWSLENEQFVNLEVEVLDQATSFVTDYFFSRRSSVGLNYRRFDDFNDDGGTFTFEHFFTPLISIRANALGFGLLEDQYSIDFAARF